MVQEAGKYKTGSSKSLLRNSHISFHKISCQRWKSTKLQSIIKTERAFNNFQHLFIHDLKEERKKEKLHF